MRKVSIIGAGEVGVSCVTCLAKRDFENEIYQLVRDTFLNQIRK